MTYKNKFFAYFILFILVFSIVFIKIQKIQEPVTNKNISNNIDINMYITGNSRNKSVIFYNISDLFASSSLNKISNNKIEVKLILYIYVNLIEYEINHIEYKSDVLAYTDTFEFNVITIKIENLSRNFYNLPIFISFLSNIILSLPLLITIKYPDEN